MSINNIKAVGDDQQWKQEVEQTIRDLRNQVAILSAQVNSRGIS